MTGTSPYDAARLLRDFPDVFSIWYELVLDRIEGGEDKNESFASRRERTRDARIQRMAKRK